MNDTAKTILRASLSPKTLIVVAAVYNCAVVWVAAAAPGFCRICPWYHQWSFTSVPVRLLAAACLLRAGRVWGDSAAIALCSFVLAESVPWYIGIYRGSLIFNLSEVWEADPFLSLHIQNLLAGIILVYAAVAWRKGIHRRGESLR